MTTSAAPGEGGLRGVGRALPFVLAAFQLAGTLGASHEQPDRRPVDALAVFLVLAGPVSLLWLRRRPVVVLGWVVLVTLAYLFRDYAYGPVMISAVVAVFGAVMFGHRLAAWLAAGTILGLHFALRGLLRDEPWSWAALAGVGAWTLLVLVSAEVARVRRERVLAARAVREQSAMRRAQEERLRIARELHDTVAHHMSLINLQAGVALHVGERRPEQVRDSLTAIRDASKEGLAELRALVDLLRDETGLAPRAPTATLESLDELVERTRRAGLLVTVRVEGRRRPLPTAVELAGFRIVQEAVTNVVRHAGAGRVEIGLSYGDGELGIQVDDDGRGGVLDVDSAGSGLTGMRERVSALDGSIRVGRSHLGGFRVAATLPVREPA